MQTKRRNETEWKYCCADSAEFKRNLGILKLVYTFLHLITVYDDDDADNNNNNNNNNNYYFLLSTVC